MATFQQIEQPKKTFFFEKKDGTVFAVGEREAVNLVKKRKLIGVSDGKKFVEVLRSAKLMHGDVVEESVYKDLLQRAFNAELEAARGKIELPVENNLSWIGKADPTFRPQ
jgi:hypothetical protein